MLIMSFASPYFKHIMSMGIGRVFNIVWICVIIAAAGVLMYYNTQCNLSMSMSMVKGPAVADVMNNSCKHLAISVIVFLALLTILNMSWGIYNTIEYDKKKQTKPVSQETHKR